MGSEKRVLKLLNDVSGEISSVHVWQWRAMTSDLITKAMFTSPSGPWPNASCDERWLRKCLARERTRTSERLSPCATLPSPRDNDLHALAPNLRADGPSSNDSPSPKYRIASSSQAGSCGALATAHVLLCSAVSPLHRYFDHCHPPKLPKISKAFQKLSVGPDNYNMDA